MSPAGEAARALIAGSLAMAVAVTGAATATAEVEPSSPPVGATELDRVRAYTWPSVVYVEVTWTGYVWDRFNKLYLNDKRPFELSSQCTGYVVSSGGYIATAGHCLDPRPVVPLFEEAAAQWALDNDYYASTALTLEEVLGFGDYVVRDAAGERGPERVVRTAWSRRGAGVLPGKAVRARVVRWQRFGQGDAALLRVAADDLNALPLAEEEVEVGTPVVAIGYPRPVDLAAVRTIAPAFRAGTVSSSKTVPRRGRMVYEISAAVSGGMSGGPTVNADGEVVGFNSFGINSRVEGRQLDFVRPADTVRDLLDEAGIVARLGADAQNYREGLDALFAGDKATAVEELTAVVDSQPRHRLAQEYLAEATALPDPPAEADQGRAVARTLGAAAGALLLAVVAAGVLHLVRRRRGAAS